MTAVEVSPRGGEEVDKLPPGDLRLDLKNPRIPDTRFEDQQAALAHLARYGALDELVKSIAASGWLNFEPLIVLEHDDELNLDNVVIEGNRRLAALLLLADPQLAESLRVTVPSGSAALVPTAVRVWMVKSRAEARSFIGFKHINGAYRWNSYAKAKFAADWLREENDIASVAQQLGDSHSTVLRLVNGYRVLNQAEAAGLTPDLGEKFAFSHLYTGLTRPGIRNFLGLPTMSTLYPENPVPEDKLDNLRELLRWLYGDKDTEAVVKSQNPDIKFLAEVLENDNAIVILRDRADLRAAYDIIEDKSELFATEVDRLWTSARAASALIGHFDGNEEVLERAEVAARTVSRMVKAMRPDDDTPSRG